MSDKKKREEIDETTTVADMNVEGFRWYNPGKKKGQNSDSGKVTKKEYRAMVKGAFAAALPMIGIVVGVTALMIVFAYLWLS